MSKKIWTWERIVEEVRQTVAREGFMPDPDWFREHDLGSLVTAVYLVHRRKWTDLRALFPQGFQPRLVRDKAGDAVVLRGKGQREGAWTWSAVVKIARRVAVEQGHLPPAGWFQRNGQASLVTTVYSLDRTWKDLQSDVGMPLSSKGWVESRNGFRWASHPEASVSNFLFARGVKHDRGRKYPEEYAEESGYAYGYYDLLLSPNGEIIDVEIWGDKPNGHDEKGYAEKRVEKERFNERHNPNFLGIHYKSCFSDADLERIFAPFIGKIAPFVFVKPTDELLQTSHWSNADDLLEACRKIASKQPDGLLPNEQWLRRRGKFKDRPGPAYNTLSIYIRTWLGGIRNARKLLGQDHGSTIKWTKESTLEALQSWYDEFGASPGAVKNSIDRGESRFNPEDGQRAARLNAAITKHVGSVIEACDLLGIKPSRRYAARPSTPRTPASSP